MMHPSNVVSAKSRIILLGHKDPAKQIDLDAGEGPFESWLAVAQDIWGEGNLTPFDNVFTATAIGALAVTGKAIFGAVCHHLGSRLFSFSREIDIWIDAYEGEQSVSQTQKRPKDKVKLSLWKVGSRQLGTKRFTKLAALQVSRLQTGIDSFSRDCAGSLKAEGNLFLADLMKGSGGTSVPLSVRHGNVELRSLEDHRNALTSAGLVLHNEYDLTSDVQGAIRKGLFNSIKVLTNIRMLKEPWRKQRLAAYYRELELVCELYNGLENGGLVAAGIVAVKP